MSNYHQLHYHAIWATKGRNSFIDNDLKTTLWNYLKGKILEIGGVAFAVGGISDHVHLCLAIPPNISVSEFIGKLKGASSHWVNHIAKSQGSFKWQDGYSAFSVSKEIMHRVIAYIENQERHHQEGTIERDWELHD